jgi:hypothetical protein
MCKLISPDKDLQDYRPSQRLTCLDIHSMRFSDGQETGHNALFGPDLFLTFDPDGIIRAASTKSLQGSSKDPDDTEYGPPEAMTHEDSKELERQLDEDFLASIWSRAGITIEVKNDSAYDIQHQSSKTSRPGLEFMSQKRQDFLRQSLGYPSHA